MTIAERVLDPITDDTAFTIALPGDPDTRNVRRQVHRAAWSPVDPTPVAAPALLALSGALAEQLGIVPSDARDSESFAALMAGNRTLDGVQPWAACYGGHQFGHWAGQLGDGRAISLAEVRDRNGQRQELQLKGAGPTPYSRTADGRAVLRSSLREFVCSEAMHHLGVPTTRALSLATTGEQVVRDMFYDGHPRPEPGAVVCRVAPSFVRFGNFEIFASRGDVDTLGQLVTWTVTTHFEDVVAGRDPTSLDVLVDWIAEVSRRTAVMIDHWMRVGFVHGVMNTDNMSILGLTIDYGPYGWLEPYDPMWTPNTTDLPGRRYAFGRQPLIAKWNLVQLARAVIGLHRQPEPIAEALGHYDETLAATQRETMAARLGLTRFTPTDEGLVEDLWEVLQVAEIDTTLFFRHLADLNADVPTVSTTSDRDLVDTLRPALYDADALDGRPLERLAGWLRRYLLRVADDDQDPDARRARMDAVNPLYVPRNYLAQQAIDAAEQGDLTELHALLEVLERPYTEQPGAERFAARRPEWARNRAGCSQLSCSS